MPADAGRRRRIPRVNKVSSSFVLGSDLVEVPCLLCGGHDQKRIRWRDQHGFRLHIAICRRDGLVFLSPRWKKEQYDVFYAKEYDRFYRPSVHGNESADDRYQPAREIWARLPQHGKNRFQTILDVGAGMGWTLDFLRQQLGPGTQLAAIEPSLHCEEHLRGPVGATLLSRDVEAPCCTSHQGRFDLIVMRHVLEHFMNPIEALVRIREWLTEEGMLYVAVPNMLLPGHVLTRNWFRLVHTYYFSPATLRATAAKAALQPSVMDTEGREIWALFVKGQSEAEDLSGLFEQEDRIIRDFRRHELRYLPTDVLGQIARTFLPRHVRVGLRRLLSRRSGHAQK
jgi:2-polyprenyl-3-methyl-5-hydroxy-6-metoxy-1,4-benzoquinol methylase